MEAELCFQGTDTETLDVSLHLSLQMLFYDIVFVFLHEAILDPLHTVP